MSEQKWIVYCCSTKPIKKQENYIYHFPRKEFKSEEAAAEFIKNRKTSKA